ncbi:MAG: hypothetical protein WAM28_04855 [Chlamydiales bacterium]
MLTKLLFFLCAACTGCASYKIPVTTSSHPACPNVATPEILLSPILEIDSKDIPSRFHE